MRRTLAAVVSVVAILGLLAPPVFAQAPAPKVTINGLVDFVSSIYKNVRDNTITNNQDRGWYSRERGVFTLTGEVGRSKGVFALEYDFTNGAGTPSSGTSDNFDLDTDEAGNSEVKWLYIETPITGAGSLMPFLPMTTIGRLGAQPARGHDYKPGIHFSGDFPGVTLETAWAPNLKSTLTFAQIGEALDELTGQNEDIAFIASVELEVFKGLTVKPTYSFVKFIGGSGSGATNLGLEQKGGFNPNGTTLHTKRHTLGGDVRWTAGPWSLQPTFLFQFGEQQTSGGSSEVDIRSWIFDTVGGFRTGPLTVEGRFAWTPGMNATDCVQAGGACGAGGEDIKYYQAINPAFVYQAGWAEIQTSGVDYNLVHFGAGGVPGVRLGQSPSYDKYGRITVAGAVDYAVTPAFVLHVVTNWMWTDKKVDTNAALGGTPVSGGDDKFLGHEWDLGFTYRFAPNIAFDLIGAYLVAGDARGTSGNDPKDAHKIAARMRITW